MRPRNRVTFTTEEKFWIWNFILSHYTYSVREENGAKGCRWVAKLAKTIEVISIFYHRWCFLLYSKPCKMFRAWRYERKKNWILHHDFIFLHSFQRKVKNVIITVGRRQNRILVELSVGYSFFDFLFFTLNHNSLRSAKKDHQ